VRKHGAQNPAYRLTSHFISFVSTPLEYLKPPGQADRSTCFSLYRLPFLSFLFASRGVRLKCIYVH